MANATKLFALSHITFVQLARPDAPNPRLSNAISSTATTLKFVNPLYGSDAAVITEAMLLGVRRSDSYVETVLIPSGSLEYDAQTANFTVGSVLTGGTSGAKALIVSDSDSGATGTLTLIVYSGTFQNNETITDAAGGSATVNGTLTAAISADGKTATGCVRGIDLDGLDWTSGDSTLAVSHKAGDAVFCNISGVIGSLLLATLTGTIATGGAGFTIGTEPGASGETTTLYRTTTAGNKQGFFRWSSNFAQFSNDGTTWTNCSDVSASDLAKVSANDTTAGYLNGKLVEGDGIDFTENNDGGNETLTVAVDATELISGDFGLETSGNDFRVKLATNPGLEFSTGLRVKVKSDGGITRDADGLSLTNLVYPVSSFYAYEAVTADQALALMPIEVEWFTQLTEADIALGDSNTRRKYAVKFYPTRTPNFTTLNFRAKENGASTMTVTLTIETDNAGAPSGTPVTNGTAAGLDSSGWTTSYGSRPATFPGVPTMSAGTAYWLVFSVNATDAANYVVLGVNSSYDENYITFERQTYNLDTTTWGGSVTNATPFFWTVSETKSLGLAVVPTDANWGGRTWSYIGHAKANASAQATVDVYTDVVPNMSVMDPARPHYLSATPGALTTTPPGGAYANGTEPTVVNYKVGQPQAHTDFKIEKGKKRIIIIESGPISATTTRQYITWFYPDIIRVGGTNSGSLDSLFTYGYVLPDGSDVGVAMTYQNAGAGIIEGSTSVSMLTNPVGDGFSGAGSALTNAGFTYTFTESGTASTNVVIEVEG